MKKKERGRVHIAIAKLAKPSHQGGRYIQSRKLRLTKQRYAGHIRQQRKMQELHLINFRPHIMG